MEKILETHEVLEDVIVEDIAPYIDNTKYGSITINGKVYHHDVIVHRDGEIETCNGTLKNVAHGGAHEITREQAVKLWEEGVKWLIIGTGKFCRCSPTGEAIAFLGERGCKVCLLPTDLAVKVWNHSKGAAVGIFHIS